MRVFENGRAETQSRAAEIFCTEPESVDEEQNELYDEREFEDNYCGCMICAQCGYRFTKADEAVKVKSTGDVIHRGCFIDYADDNIDEMTSEVITA